LFLCTANVTDTIPGPLLDRMEVIELAGYMADEKVAIAERYLIPQAQKETGLSSDKFTIKEDALQTLIKSYCRESGVRNLKKHIDKIFRKGALEMVKTETPPTLPIVVSADSLTSYVGQPIFSSTRMYDVTPPGVVMGLAWTAMGGSVLYIETVASRRLFQPPAPKDPADPSSTTSSPTANLPSTPGFALTGSLGNVMKESAQIAYTLSKHFLEEVQPENTFFSRADVRLHVPEGATPKDGPSAGCTMVTALVSLATNTPVRPNLAMTGEVSLTGKVLRVGGIKEKTLAAKRSGVTTIILPELNRADWAELPASVKQDMEVHFVKDYAEIYKIVFEGQQRADTPNIAPSKPPPLPTEPAQSTPAAVA